MEGDEAEGWRAADWWLLPLAALAKLLASPLTEPRFRTLYRLLLAPMPAVNDHLDYESVLRAEVKRHGAARRRPAGGAASSKAAAVPAVAG